MLSMRKGFVLSTCLILVFSAAQRIEAGFVAWNDAAVTGEDSSQLPGGVSGSIEWNVVNGNTQLQFVVKSTTAGVQPNSGWVLSGFVFKVDSAATLTPASAIAADVINRSGFTGNDVSGQWAAGQNKSVFGSNFDWAVGAVGDIDFGSDTIGTGEIIDPSKTQKSPAPNGIDFSILSAAGHANQGSFKKKGVFEPMVQDMVTVTFDVGGSLSMSDIVDVRPYFGTDWRCPDDRCSPARTGIDGGGHAGRPRRHGCSSQEILTILLKNAPCAAACQRATRRLRGVGPIDAPLA